MMKNAFFFSNSLCNCSAKHKLLEQVLGISVVRMHKGKKQTVSCDHLTLIYSCSEVYRYSLAGFNQVLNNNRKFLISVCVLRMSGKNRSCRNFGCSVYWSREWQRIKALLSLAVICGAVWPQSRFGVKVWSCGNGIPSGGWNSLVIPAQSRRICRIWCVLWAFLAAGGNRKK